MMKRILRTTVITVVFLAAASAAFAALPSVQAFVEPSYAIGYANTYYSYRISAGNEEFINEARIKVPPGVSVVSAPASGMASATPVIIGDEIIVSYTVPWNVFSNPNFDIISFYAVSDTGDKYYGSYFNATPDAAGITPTGYSQYVNIRTCTPTYSASPTISQTPTVSETAAGSFTITETFSMTPTITVTHSKSETPNWTATQTATGTPPTPTVTPSVTRTWTRTATQSRTRTATPTATRSATPTGTFTVTLTPTVTNTITIQGIDVSVYDFSRYTAASGEPSAPLSRIGFTNIGGAAEDVSGLRVSLKNSYGAALDMSEVFVNLYLVDAGGATLSSASAPAASSQYFVLAPALSVPLQATRDLYLYADIKNTTFTASIAAGVEAPTDVTCAVPVAAASPYVFPVYPQPATVKLRTQVLSSAYFDLMPPSVSTGQKNVYAFMLTMQNPGGGDYSAALLNYLTITVKDSLGNPIPADSALSRLEVRDAGRAYFSTSAIPSGSTVLCALAEPVTVEASAVKNIYFIADIKDGGGTAANFRLSIDSASDFKMSEYHYGMPVLCQAAAGFAFPQESSSALIQNKAYEMEVECSGLMPAYVSAGQDNVPAMNVVLTNKGNSSTASAMVTRMTFYLNDASNLNLNASLALDSIKVTSQDGLVVYGQLSSFTGAKMTVNFTSPVVVSPAAPVTVGVRLGINPAYYGGAFKLNLNSGDDVYAVDANIFETIPVTSPSAFPKRTGAAQMQERAMNAYISNFTPLLPAAALKGQAGMPVLSFMLSNTNGALAAAEELYGINLTVRNSAGTDIAASSAISYVYAVDSAGNTIATATAGLQAETALNISPAYAVSQGSAVTVFIYADIPASASAADFTVSIQSVSDLWVRDINSKEECVKNPAAALPWQAGPALIYSSPATDVSVSGDGNIAPVMVGRGQPDVRMMIFSFYNPGGIGTADVAVRGITVTALDETGTMIAPASAMTAAEIINSSTLAVCGGINLSGMTTAGPFYIPADAIGLYAPYGNTVSAYISADISLSPSVNSFRLRVLTEQEIDAISSPSGAITKSPAPGAVFPVDSKITTISSFAMEFKVGHTAMMPVSAVQGQAGITAMRVLFENPNSSPLSVTSVAIAVKDRDGVPIATNALVSAFYIADEAGNTVATAAAPASGNVVLHPASYSVAGNSSGYMDIRFDLSAGRGMFYFELETAASVGTLPASSVIPVSGDYFGNMKSGTLSIQVPDFAASSHVFPNPLLDPETAPARVEYYLPELSRVTIRIFTAAGKPVFEVVNGAIKQPGLHSEDAWPAVNTAGRDVRSGVYLVIIEAEGVLSGTKMKAVEKMVVLR